MMKAYQVPGEGGSPESVSLGSSPVTVSLNHCTDDGGDVMS